MRDSLNEIIRFSPYGGELILEEVKGTTSGKINPENNVVTVCGADRDMYSYIPRSGCPHAKQCQVLMVLRDDCSRESAEELLDNLKLRELAESRHFILLFPNPLESEWNYTEDTAREDDIQFLIRCFAALPKSKGRVAGFNGMIFYLATSKATSAMVMTLAAESPLDAAAVMLTAFPEGYCIPKGKGAPQVAWLTGSNNAAEAYLQSVNDALTEEDQNGLRVCVNGKNPHVRFFASSQALTAEEVELAWDRMFSETRRWRNDVAGTYQARTNFSQRQFIRHYQDTSLGVNNHFPHTWYEYIPPQLRGSEQKAPLVFYMHGVNCVALYSAEQSGWHDIADREGFIVVYPEASIEERWNIWDDPQLPSDMSFILALIEHMDQVHPIEKSRVYISGFSMGSMFSNALACSHPEAFAGVVACNGPHLGYFQTLEQAKPGMLMLQPTSIIGTLPPSDRCTSVVHDRADEKKEATDYRMPFVQCIGLLDDVGFARGSCWPLTPTSGSTWLETINYWKKYNNIPIEEDAFSSHYESGLLAHVSEYEGDDQRFLHQSWFARENGKPLYQLVSAKRMPHAVDLKEFEIGWSFIKQFSRNADGTLSSR